MTTSEFFEWFALGIILALSTALAIGIARHWAGDAGWAAAVLTAQAIDACAVVIHMGRQGAKP